MVRVLKNKYFWIVLLIVVVVSIFLFIQYKPKAVPKPVYTVSAQDVRQTVIATGTVTSGTDVSLSFKNSGILRTLNVKVGDKVKVGQILAKLDDADAKASVSQANSQLLVARAAYRKIVNGASGPDIDVSKANVTSATTTLSNAQTNLKDVTAAQDVLVQNSKNTLAQARTNLTLVKNQQDQFVKNALAVLLNSGLVAVPATTTDSLAPVVTGTYTGPTQGGEYTISTYRSGYYHVSGLNTVDDRVTLNVPLAIGQGLYVTFDSFSLNDTWTITVPNTFSSGYTANNNTYQSALQTQTQALSSAQTAIDNATDALNSVMQAHDQTINNAQSTVESAKSALAQANASLALKVTAARPEDIQSAQASIAQAEAALELARNTLSNTVIVAPISGQITKVDAKLGEQVVASKQIIDLLDADSLHVESYVPESSIGSVSINKPIDMTLDAIGPDTHLSGKVISIDPAATVISGVIEFRVLSSLPTDTRIAAGMTVNLTIIAADKPDVLAVPNRLVGSEGSQSFVMVLRGSDSVKVPVTIGLVGDNYSEVAAGLVSGDLLLSPTP